MTSENAPDASGQGDRAEASAHSLPTLPAGSGDSEEVLRTLLSILSNLTRIHGEIRTTNDLKPRPDSRAATELAEQDRFAAWGPTAVLNAHSLADGRLMAAARHLDGLRVLMTEPLQSFGQAALARSALECLARASWALDPGIDVETRVLRTIADRFGSLLQTAKIPIPDIQEHAKGRITKLGDQAAAAGVSLSPNPVMVGAVRLPLYIDLIRELAGDIGEAAWRNLSAVAHGEIQGLLGRSRVVRRYEGGAFVQPGDAAESLSVDVGLTTESFLNTFQRQIDLYGWDPIGWRSFAREARRALLPLLQES